MSAHTHTFLNKVPHNNIKNLTIWRARANGKINTILRSVPQKAHDFSRSLARIIKLFGELLFSKQ